MSNQNQNLSSNIFFVYGICILVSILIKTLITLWLDFRFSPEGIAVATFFTALGLVFIRLGYREVRGKGP